MIKALKRNPEVFSKVLSMAVSGLSIDDMLTKVVEEVRDLAGCDRCSLYIVDKEKNELYTKIAQKLELGEIRVSIDKRSIAGYCAFTGKDLLVKDVRNEKDLKKIDDELSFNEKFDEECGFTTKNALCTPIKYRGEVIGAIQAVNKTGGFMAMDVENMAEFSSILGLILFNVLISTQLEECESGK
ncbi:MAG: GAF domain-containing protein [Thermodesulfobacteriota bacterium]